MANIAYNIERFTADVLVIGGGLAGAVAALKAREGGASVIVLEKGNTYRSGNAGSGLDHMFSYVPPVHEKVGYTKEHMKRDFLEIGQTPLGITADHAASDYFVDVSYERIIGLEKYGINFRFADSHLSEGLRLVPQFHSIPTSLHFEGRDIKVKLTEAMLKAGVEIINHAQAVEILTDAHGNAAGAIAVSTREEKIIAVESKTTILATNSGANRLGEKGNATQPYFEAPSAANSGFGVTLPLNAGAELVNLEFMITNGSLGFQGFGFTAGAPGGTWWPAARVVDDEGNVVVERVTDYDINEPDYLQKNIDQMAKYAFQKVSMGKYLAEGKQLYVDLREATDAEVDYIRWSMFNEGQCWLYLQHLDENDIDLKKVKQPYVLKHKVGIGGFAKNAGVYVNTSTETTVGRLYAAGDVTGGKGFISAAPYAVVFGQEAGLQAAAKAKDIDNVEPASQRQIDHVLGQIERLRNSENGEPWQDVEQELRGIITVFGIYPLSDSKIDSALALIGEIKRRDSLKAANPHELSRCYEVISLAQTAEAIFTAAKNRKKNVGHFKRHEDGARRIYGERITLENGELVPFDHENLPSEEIYFMKKNHDNGYEFRTLATNQ